MGHFLNGLKLKIWNLTGGAVKAPGLEKTFVRHGLRPVSIVRVAPQDLYCMRPVHCNEYRTHHAGLFPWYEDYFRGDWHVYNSPLVKLLNSFGRMADVTDAQLADTDYYRMQTSMRVGHAARSDEWLFRKMRDFLALTRKIAEQGYDYSRLSNYIVVVDRPVCSTRYGITHDMDGYEVYTGHHRAAIANYLRMSDLYAVLARDIARRTPFGIELEDLRREDNEKSSAGV